MQPFLRQQINRARNACFSVLTQGPDAIKLYSRTWSALHSTLSEAVAQDQIDDETISLANEVAETVGTIVSGFIGLYTKAEDFAASVQTDFAAAFSELSISESPPPQLPSNTELLEKTQSSKGVPTVGVYIGPAYRWLLENLHNPYPSKDVKLSIARETGSKPKDVENWFVSVRKRIGWNALRQKHFKNNRSLIVRAATSFYCDLPREPLRFNSLKPFNLSAGYEYEFIQIQHNLHELYADKLFQSPLATSLSPALNSQYENTSSRRTSDSSAWTPDMSYPSPRYSPEPAVKALQSEPTITLLRKRGLSCEETDLESDAENTRLTKRRRPANSPPPESEISAPLRRKRDLSSESADVDPSLEIARPTKKSRRVQEAMTGLPSPAASVSDPLDVEHHQVDELPILHSPSGASVISRNRKRRLSDSELSPSHKRQHMAMSIPRLQAVSNPLPISTILSQQASFEQLCEDFISSKEGITELSLPVPEEVLEDMNPWDIQLYDYSTQLSISEQTTMSPPNLNSMHSAAVTPFTALPADAKDFIYSQGVELSVLEDISWVSDAFATSFSSDNSQFLPSFDQFVENDIHGPETMSVPNASMWSLPEDFSSFQMSSYQCTPSAGHIPSTLSAEDKIAKNERLQFLRDELRRLEAEIS